MAALTQNILVKCIIFKARYDDNKAEMRMHNVHVYTDMHLYTLV